MTDHPIIIAGAGPTGSMLGAELKLAGVDALIIEKRVERERVQPGALGLHARTIELFDQRGIADRFLAQGTTAQVVGFAGVRLDISDFPTRHPYGLSLVQKQSERILLDWAEELGVTIIRGREIVDFAEDASGISVRLDDGSSLRGQYLVGCDGGRSFVRKAAGIAFPGSDPTISHLLAEAEITASVEFGLRRDAIGTQVLSPAPNGKVGIMVTEAIIGSGQPTLETLGSALVAHYGTDLGAHNPTYITRFTDMTRQAETYRKGRVLLAGDAAHIHYPAGGFGMGIGLADAVNLGWKLAEVVRRGPSETLLDTYHAERHPVAEALLRYTMATVALSRTDDRSKALSAVVAELIGMDEPGRVTAGRMSGLDTRYDFGPGHPLLGRRMPDLDLVTSDGTHRVYSFMHDAAPLLISFGQALDAGNWSGRLRTVTATHAGDWVLPMIGRVDPPAAVLVRPDGHVAWAGDGGQAGLHQALERWFSKSIS